MCNGKTSEHQRYSKELTFAEKELIKSWVDQGKSQKEIAQLLQISPQRVSYTLKTFNSRIFSNRKVSCGRKVKINSQVKKLLIEKVNENRFISGPQLVSIVKEETGIIVCPKTAKAVISKDGFSLRSPRKVPLISLVNQKNRLRLAKDFLTKPKTFWNKVIWSDETKIELYRTQGKMWVWRLAGEEFNSNCTLKTVKHGGVSTMLWGCMAANGVGNLVEINGTMTGLKYVALLQENLFDSADKLGLGSNFVFQQDNDPKHTSAIAKQFFQNNNIEVLEWPSQSPDINVIEHLWAELKRRYGDITAKNKSEMIQKLQQIWIELGKEFAKKLVNGVYKRFIAVIEAKGCATRY